MDNGLFYIHRIFQALFIISILFASSMCKHEKQTSCKNLSLFSFWSDAQDISQMDLDPLCNFLTLPTSETKTIHVSVVACGDRLEETLAMVKSALILSNEKLHFHIFADDELRIKFKRNLSAWLLMVQKFEFTVYPITYPSNQDAEEWKNIFKPCATQRLFLPYVMPPEITDTLLYVDTDILFMRPVEDVWNLFNRFNSSHISALAPEHEWDRQGWYNRFARHPYYGERGVNSGVMLMHLKRMRESNWIDNIISYHKEYKLKITWGDQDLINIFFHYFPEKLYVFPCHWNLRPDHCMYGLNCKQAEKRGVSVVHGCRGVYHDEKQPVFKAIYKVIVGYQFDSDLMTSLLIPMKKSIKELESSGYCGRVGSVFTQQLERQINIKEKCIRTATCLKDSYEPEDFSLEPKKNSAKVTEKKLEIDKTDKDDKAIKRETENLDQKNINDTENKTIPENESIYSFVLSEMLYKSIKDGILKTFPKIAKRKVLSILIEHYTRLQDARERHLKAVARPQENSDTALLSGDLHEELLGYLSNNFQEMDSPDEYLHVLKAVIEKLKLTKDKKVNALKNKNDIHVVVVACGDRLEEPIVMMKSAILLAKNFLNFHVFAEEHLQPKFKDGLDAWPENLQHKFKLHIHDIQYPKGNAEDWKKLFKKCATQRLFLSSLMTDVDSVIYVDTDILFLRPIDDLWNRFKDFNSTHISGLAPEHEDAHVSWYKRFARHPYYPPLGVNSGVMLMNLTRMRESKWLDYVVPYFHEYRYNTTWGDQDLINIFFHFFPEKLYIFPCDWNYRQDHCMYMHVCKRAEEHGVSILHGARGVYHNEKELSFRRVYEAMRDYQFGTDMKENLIKNIQRNVKQAANTNCGKVGWVLTKQFEQQINKILIKK